MVRLVPVDRNVFQPRVTRLEGADAVLQHLKRSGDHAGLAAAANQLMRGPRLDDERAFDAVDGDWVPGEVVARRDSNRPSAMPPGGSHSGELAEVRAELLVLRASHERLRERVQRLESQLTSAGRTRDVLSIPPTPSFVMPKASDPSPAPAGVSASTSAQPAATRVSGEGMASEAPAGLGLPTVQALNASLLSLVGERAGVREKRPLNFAPEALGACWLSRLIDDEGIDVGAIVADRAATATLGGMLIALPEHEIEAQRALEAPSEDVLGAMGEVANSLCEAMNKGSSGPQVRVKPLEPLEPGQLAWVNASGRGLELELVEGFGRLFVFAR